MTDHQKIKRIEHHRVGDPVETIDREFAAYDNKGRQFGASVTLFTVDYVPFDGTEERWQADYSQPCGWRAGVPEPGTRYAYNPHALRGGERYGALQRTVEFESEAERAEAVERYFAGAEKRALKNKARVR